MGWIAARLDSGWRRYADPAWLEHWHPRAFPLAGGATERVEMGEGPPILLLPPLPGFKEAWLALAPRLAAAGFRVAAFDLRTRFAGHPRWEPLVEDVLAMAGSMPGAPPVVVGHSLGGALALRFALAHPGRVRALVLSSSFRHVFTPPRALYARYVEQPAVLAALRLLPERAAVRLARALARRQRWVFDRRCDPFVCGLMVRGIRTISPALVRDALRLAFAHDLREQVPAITAPTLLVRGERDTPFAILETGQLARAIRGAVTVVSPDAGHLHPLSNPGWLADAIAGWVRGLPGA